MSHPEPSVEDVIRFVRKTTRSRRTVTAETRIERDLGVTGDDGAELLAAAEGYFGVALSTPEQGFRPTFGLGPNEYLFGPEGLGLLGVPTLIRWLRRQPRPVYRDLTVTELHEAIRRARAVGGAR